MDPLEIYKLFTGEKPDVIRIYMKPIRRLQDFMEAQQPSEWTVLDIGAHKGGVSVTAYALGCAVVSVEPMPGNLEVLRPALAERPRAILLPVAVMPGQSSVEMRGVRGSSGQCSAMFGEGFVSMGAVPALELADVLAIARAMGRPKLYLKMDVEGAEYAIFAGDEARALLLGVDALDIEWHIADAEIASKFFGDFDNDEAQRVEALVKGLGWREDDGLLLR